MIMATTTDEDDHGKGAKSIVCYPLGFSYLIPLLLLLVDYSLDGAILEVFPLSAL